MSELERARRGWTPVAVGNHLYGYRAELVTGYGTDAERVRWRCGHTHRTTRLARSCALRHLGEREWSR